MCPIIHLHIKNVVYFILICTNIKWLNSTSFSLIYSLQFLKVNNQLQYMRNFVTHFVSMKDLIKHFNFCAEWKHVTNWVLCHQLSTDRARYLFSSLLLSHLLSISPLSCNIFHEQPTMNFIVAWVFCLHCKGLLDTYASSISFPSLIWSCSAICDRFCRIYSFNSKK